MKKIAYIGVGGTIASVGRDAFDLLDYNETNIRIDAASVVARTGAQGVVANIVPIEFRRLDSTAITNRDWYLLARHCEVLLKDPTIDGLVVGQGTASLEETAWLLDLVLQPDKPVVVTGAMRPASGISADGNANLVAAIRVAASEVAAGAGVLVVLNDEIHAARSVTKTHTVCLNAFQSPWSGPIGYVDGSLVYLSHRRTPLGLGRFTADHASAMPRVDVIYSYLGADGAAVRAFLEAGAVGLVSAGFCPGAGTPAEMAALSEAAATGIRVVQSSRGFAGRVVDSAQNRRLGIIAGSDLSPQKARILLALALARGDNVERTTEIFTAI